MYPISYKKNGDIVKFRYDTKEYNKWKELGSKDGNVGQILVSIDYKDNIMNYKGFGTIEAPIKTLMYISLVHLPLLDGELREPEQYLEDYIKQYEKDNPISTKMEMKFIDLSEYNNKPNIQKFKK